MASWREIDRLRKRPKELLLLGKRLSEASDLTDWERDFLASIEAQAYKEEFSTRQAEKLLQIRDNNDLVTELPGKFSVKLILATCLMNRTELSEDDEWWLTERLQTSADTIRRKHIGRLMTCARQLRLIESDALVW